MSGKKTFTVFPIGIANSEKKVLRNIFKLSLYRPRSYKLFESPADGVPEIALVDAATAPDDWERFRYEFPDAPVLQVAAQPSAGNAQPTIRRPFVASRLLSLFDQLPIRGHPVIDTPAAQPAAAEAKTPDTTSAILANAAAEISNSHKALVVDDSLPIRKQMEIELELLGVSADFAESGERAFEYLDRRSYDIVFLDVVLPGVDGYRICKKIKKNGATKKTPVVMLTSKSSPFDRVRGTFAGCDTYLTKPVTQDSFKKVVRKYLG